MILFLLKAGSHGTFLSFCRCDPPHILFSALSLCQSLPRYRSPTFSHGGEIPLCSCRHGLPSLGVAAWTVVRTSKGWSGRAWGFHRRHCLRGHCLWKAISVTFRSGAIHANGRQSQCCMSIMRTVRIVPYARLKACQDRAFQGISMSCSSRATATWWPPTMSS